MPTEVELFLNGQSLGRKKRFSEPVELPVGPNVSADGKFLSKYRLLWRVPYQPGTLKAVAYQDGKAVASEVVAHRRGSRENRDRARSPGDSSRW